MLGLFPSIKQEAVNAAAVREKLYAFCIMR